MRQDHETRRMGAIAWTGLAGWLALVGGCEAPELDVGQAQLALGEPQDGFPDWQERLILEWTNRARCDPAADLAGCTVCAERACYTPVQPLVWNHNLARAARFHSANLVLTGSSLRHDSPCTLVSTIATDYVPGPCSGDESCACVGGTVACSPTCTTWSARVGLFGTPANGENIAYGYTDPDRIFYMWLWEPDSSTACGWRMSNGHRANILGGSRALGVGRNSTHYTQDFGASGTPSGVVSGVHYPQTGTSLQFWANWYATAAPASAVVNIDGTCHTLTRARGSDTNGAWSATIALAAGACHRYYFRFTDAAGTAYDYPTTGSFGINCADWEATRPATCGCTPACTGRECGPDGCGGSCGACAPPEVCNASGVCGCAPACTGRECGPDGCGGSCGACAPPEVCNASGVCACTPACTGRECGDDGCGGSCGLCDFGLECNPSGNCVPTGADADADADADPDVTTDTGADAEPDTTTDTGADAEPDTTTDTGADAEPDTTTDTGADADGMPVETTCDPSACDADCRSGGHSGGSCRSGSCFCSDGGDAGDDTAGDGGADDDAGSGCSCAVPARPSDRAWLALGLAAAVLVFRRRR